MENNTPHNRNPYTRKAILEAPTQLSSLDLQTYRIHLGRLIQEEHGVEGCFLFHRRADDDKSLHIFGNVARLIFKVATAPILQWSPHVVTETVLNLSKWQIEYADTPAAVLLDTKGQTDRVQYSVTGFKPAWILKVDIRDGKLFGFNQVPFSEAATAIGVQGYTAISYPMESAVQLAGLEHSQQTPNSDGRRYSLGQKQNISKHVLALYCSADRPGMSSNRTEYIWLDEFCLSNERDSSDIEAQRDTELGRLADVFRYATNVVVFCNRAGCDHTYLDCPWGNRIWTIPEILHADRILRMTRDVEEGNIITRIFPMSGRDFREAIQNRAAMGDQWHLYAIYQNSLNSGAVPWQVAIHSLVVEAIRRDEAGQYDDHKYLGRALNGLLPRRAHLDDLGRGGWNDLAWLLELNQGFYNAASLAALCALPEESAVSWLGKPIQPKPGNERLQPIVTALPVCPPSLELSMEKKGGTGCPPLMIIGGEMVGIRPHLRRDWAGLYNNSDLRPLRICAGGGLAAGFLLGLILLGTGHVIPGLVIFFGVGILHVILELLISTMFLERKGWVFLPNDEWGGDIDTTQQKMGYLDSYFTKLKLWGKSQLVPEWQNPTKRECIHGRFLDLESGIYVDVSVIERPNVIVPLAIHGNGVTCLLLHRSGREHEKVFGAQKVGIANFPPHILAQTTKMGTVCIGGQWEEKEKIE
ncbi:hypothetical protein DFH06DRAFT_1093960 [Mycena polygramma]|nr:hypothetical protein DFH06DRAFT_1093960 [Mycena polygramma]